VHRALAKWSNCFGREYQMIREDKGSIIPLGIGVMGLSLVFSLVMVELISSQYQTMQAKQVADVLTLQVAGDLKKDEIPPVIGLDYFPVTSESLNISSRQLGIEPINVKVTSPDGKTIAATVCVKWKSVTGFSLGNAGTLCATSKARAI